MCVSNHMGLQNRVGRSGFFVCNIFVLYTCDDFRILYDPPL